MKKLMVAAAVALVGVAASASSVTWGVDGSETLDTTKFTKGHMYMCYTADADGIDWAGAIAAAQAAKTFSYDTIAAAGFEKVFADFAYDAATKVNDSGVEITPSSTGLTQGMKSTYYICIADDGQAMAYTTDPIMVNVKATQMTVGAVTGADSFSYASIPEPTSGLLLLLGVAGLALRRRRA